MRFINPRTDFAFKKIFGSAESRPILISFLNAILYEGEPVIVDLEILDPYSVPRLEGMKDTYLDVRARLRDGQMVLIEMQVLNLPGFEKRILYNAAKEYANQLQRGQDYHALNPVIALTITDFVMFTEPEIEHQIISRYVLLEKDKLIRYPDGDVELVFVELPKFNLELEELVTLTEKWLYFLRAAPDIEVVPESLASVPEIGRAFEIAEYSRLSKEEEEALDKKLRWVADQRSLLEGRRQAEETARQAEETARQAEETARQAEETARQAEETARQAEAKLGKVEETAKQAEAKLGKAVAMLRSSGMTDEEIVRELGLGDLGT
jgi:predicted transposase/invertase (TIGR01784 family)